MAVGTWQVDGNPVAMGMRWMDISPMVVGDRFTDIDLRTESVHSHQRSSTQIQQTDAYPRAAGTQQTDNSPRDDTICPYPKGLRRARRIVDSLRTTSTQQIGAHSRAMDRQ